MYDCIVKHNKNGFGYIAMYVAIQLLLLQCNSYRCHLYITAGLHISHSYSDYRTKVASYTA